jgi:hypothetical protein
MHGKERLMMTLLKKLSIAIVLALGVQLSAAAFFTTTETEQTRILKFAQTIRQQNSSVAQNVAQWLEDKAINASVYYDIATIINIIENDDLTMQSKLTLFSTSMKKEISARRWQKCADVATAIFTGTLFVGMCTLATWAIIQDVKNPRYTVYTIQDNPSVSVTWRTRR